MYALELVSESILYRQIKGSMTRIFDDENSTTSPSQPPIKPNQHTKQLFDDMLVGPMFVTMHFNLHPIWKHSIFKK